MGRKVSLLLECGGKKNQVQQVAAVRFEPLQFHLSNDAHTLPLASLMILSTLILLVLVLPTTLGINLHENLLDDGTEDDEEEHAEGRESKDN